jgi:hypothetical protein
VTPPSRWPGIVSIVFGALLLVGIAQSCLAHASFVSDHPFNVGWIAIAIALATLTLLANRAEIDLRAIAPYLGFGGIGCVLAFVLQGIVNPLLARSVGPAPLGAGSFLLLGIGAAVCQTLGKWGVVQGLDLLLRPTSPRAVLALGLGVGLGFAGTEIVVIGQQTIGSEAALTPPALLSLWERASAGGFHVYSGALIAIGVVRRKLAWIAVVVLLHSLLDGLAGAVGAGLVPLPLPAIETVFLLVAIASWAIYLRAKQGLEPWMVRGDRASLTSARG